MASGKASGRTGVTRLRSAIVLLVVGIGLVVAMVIAQQQQGDFAASANQATGTVVDNVSQRHYKTTGQQSRTVYHAVVEFTAADGTTVKFTNDAEYDEPIDTGEQVTVYYQPAAPEDARLAADLSSMWPWWGMAVGAVLAALGVLPLVQAWRARRGRTHGGEQRSAT